MNDITYVGKHTVIYTVSRHAHESWEFVYCTYGSGTFLFDDRSLDYREGDVVIIPPMTPHSNASADGFQNIHINMVSPALSFSSPLVISDDSNHFLLDAFNAVFFHFYSDRKETSSLLSVYGDLIVCYLAAYRTGSTLTPIVARIEHNIIANYADYQSVEEWQCTSHDRIVTNCKGVETPHKYSCSHISQTDWVA